MSGSELILNSKTDSRDYGIDLLRLLCMFMVCVLHVLSYGGFSVYYSDYPLISFSVSVLNAMAFCCVNCYILVSGYFGMKSKKHSWNRMIDLWMSVFFYSVVLGVISFVAGVETFGPLNLIKIFLPLTTDRYWFFSAYVIVFLVGPYICKLVETTPQKTLKVLMFIFLLLLSLLRFPSLFFAVDPFVLGSGRSPFWLCFVYFVGAYLNKYPIGRLKGRRLFSFILYLLFSGVIMLESFLIEKICQWIGWERFDIINNNQIWVILCAICLLYCFVDLKIAPSLKKPIKIFTPCVFGVYLIHMHPYGLHFIRNIAPKVSEIIPLALIPLSVIIISLAVFIVCIVLDYIRSWVFRLLRVNELSKRLGEKIYDLMV